jgi:hypothetical protein
MNKNYLFVCSILALSLSWVGCHKSKLEQRSTFSPPSGPVELKIKWPKGERVVQSLVVTQSMVMNIPGMPTPMQQDIMMGQDYGFTVLDETPDGKHEIEMDFLSAKMSSTMSGKTLVDYDSSKKPAPDAAPDPFGSTFGKIIGSKIQFYLDATNAVERIEGVDDLLNRMSTGGAPADQLAMLRNMFNEGYFKQIMSQYQVLPPNAVQPGDTWPVHLEFPIEKMGSLVVDDNFTFQNWEIHGKRYCARLEFQGTIKSGSSTGANPAGMSINILGGNCSGSSWFDPELGITIDTTMNQDMSMAITFPMPGRGKGTPGQMQTMTNQMTQTIFVKLLSVK